MFLIRNIEKGDKLVERIKRNKVSSWYFIGFYEIYFESLIF